MGKTFAARLEALERVEAQRVAEKAVTTNAAGFERYRRRLHDLGFTADTFYTICECCRWEAPGIRPTIRSPLPNQELYRCIICGGCTYGFGADGIWSYRAQADYVCPRCGGVYQAPRRTAALCPACGWFPPPFPGVGDDHSLQCFAGGVGASLARRHGPAVALAWLDEPDEAGGTLITELADWWLDAVPRDLLNGLRADLADGLLAVNCSRHGGTGEPAASATHAVWEGPSPRAGSTPPEYDRRIAGAALLDRLLDAHHKAGAPVVTSPADAQHMLDTLIARLETTPAQP